jgi:hypothetical protein
MRKQANTLDKFQAAIASVYAEKTGMSPKDIKAMMDEETWMTAMQAKRLGFADAVRGRASVKPAGDGTNNLKIGGVVFNLAKYKNSAAVRPSSVGGLNDREAILNHMAGTARAALGMKSDTSAGASFSKAARISDLRNDKEAIHNHMAEVAGAALGKKCDQKKINNLRNDKEAIQEHMARVAKAAL